VAGAEAAAGSGFKEQLRSKVGIQLLELRGEAVPGGLFAGDRVERAEQADIGHNGFLVLGVAVAVGGDVEAEVEVDEFAATEYSPRVFNHLELYSFGSGVPIDTYRVLFADGETAATAGATAADFGDVLDVVNGVVRTIVHAIPAACALFRVNLGFGVGVHFEFAGFGGKAHGEVLDDSAEAGDEVSLEVSEVDDIADSAEAVGKTGNGDKLGVERDLVGLLTVPTVEDLERGEDVVHREAVFVRQFQVLRGLLAAAAIEGSGLDDDRLQVVVAGRDRGGADEFWP
jgi:hypothetical protein